MFNAAIDFMKAQVKKDTQMRKDYDHQVNYLNIEVKSKDEIIMRLESDIQSLKELNSSSVYQQYILLAEQVSYYYVNGIVKNSGLIKEKNQMLFKVEEQKDEINQYISKYDRAFDEL